MISVRNDGNSNSPKGNKDDAEDPLNLSARHKNGGYWMKMHQYYDHGDSKCDGRAKYCPASNLFNIVITT